MPQTCAGQDEKIGEIMKKDLPLRSPFLNLKEATNCRAMKRRTATLVDDV